MRFVFLKCAFNEVDEPFMNQLNRLFQTWLMGFSTLCPYPIPGNRIHKALQAKRQLSELLLQKVNDFRTQNPPGSNLASTTLMGRLCYGVDDDGNTDMKPPPLCRPRLYKEMANLKISKTAGQV